MKHLIRLTALLLCLSLLGCSQPQETPQGSIPSTAPSTQPSNPGKPLPGETVPTVPGTEVAFENPGVAKVQYSVNVSSVRYITEASQLPNYDALKKYDAAFFETKALVVILDSVSSGAIQPHVHSITFDNGKNTVVLGRDIDSTVTIPVMTTWLIWAEVERELPGSWMIHNPSLPSNNPSV